MFTTLFVLAILAYYGASIEHVVNMFITDVNKMEELQDKYGDSWIIWSIFISPAVYTVYLWRKFKSLRK